MKNIIPTSLLLIGMVAGICDVRADSGGPTYLLQKLQLFYQADTTGAVAPPYSYDISIHGPTTVTAVTLPNSTSLTLTLNTSDQKSEYTQLFTSKAALDAGFPNGAYVYGTSNYSLSLASDAYPTATPQVIGGTWNNGLLVLDPAVSNTLQFSSFTTYSSGTLGHEAFSLNPQNSSSNLSIQQDAVSIAAFGNAASPAFTSYTIPAGQLSAGTIYQCELDFDAVTVYDANNAAVSIFGKHVFFFAVGKTATTPAAPVITTQPTNQTGALGDNVTFSVAVSNLGANPFTTWYKDGVPLNLGGTAKYILNVNNGVLSASLQVKNLTAADAGSYYAQIITPGGVVTTNVVTIAIVAPSQPAITTQPIATVTINQGGSTTLSVVATGGGLSYQWKKDGVNIGGNQATLPINNAQSGAAGSYTVTVTNSVGSALSTSAIVTVNVPNPLSAPVITSFPQPITVAPGSTAVFNVTASGNPAPTYTWSVGSTVIGNSNSPRYVVSNAQVGGSYTVSVSNSQGTVSSSGVNLTVQATTNPGRLVNLSVLSRVQGSLTMGYVIGGSGVTGSESLLIRATGPVLAQPPFSVPGVMTDPTLTVVKQNGGVTLATNAGWGANQSAVMTTGASIGAFPLTDPTSKDSALVTSLPVSVGGYTATVASASSGSGYALTEVYDATTNYTAANPRLVNLSCLTGIAAGSTLNVGFVVGGSTAKTVLIRVSGPTLAAAPFSIGGTMPDPKLVVQPLNSTTVVAANTGWRGDLSVANAASNVGAFALLSPPSLDSATLVTLAPGGYTVVASSATGAGGLVLVEIYEVP